ncbi:MAG: beta-propeller domain-containing protein [Thermoproteota archaeon]
MKPEKKSILIVVLVFVILPASFAGILRLKAIFEHENTIQRFESYQQLKQFLATHQKGAYWPYITLDGSIWFGPSSSLGGMSVARELNKYSDDVQYSKTNVQVEGVDEADTVKTDGRFIYILSDEEVLLIDAYPPEKMSLLSTIDLNGHPSGIFVSGNRLVVLEQIFSYRPIPEGEEIVMPEIIWWIGNASVKIYDISERRDPRLLKSYQLNDFYSDSRMLEPYIYIVVSEPAMIYNENVILPRVYGCGWVKEIEASDIYYYESTEGPHNFITIFALNVQDQNAEPSYETFLAASSDLLFMSSDNIYIAQTIWERAEGTALNDIIIPSYEVTVVHKMHVDGLKIRYIAKGEVPGHVLNQFSRDEFDGFFRIATTSIKNSVESFGRLAETNNIYVLDGEMKIVGKLEDLAPGESVHSVRFMGDKCYIVTFKKVDPLFVVDLSSPTDPRILGRVKIPGYSNYLHPFGEGFLIGVGKDTVEAEEGDFAWYQGVKISIFDVREYDHPIEKSKLIVGDRGSESPVLTDHKAFLLDLERRILVMPVLVAAIDPSKYPGGVPPNAHGEYIWQGVYVLEISTEDGIRVLGRITHIEDEEEIQKSGYYFYSRYSVKRAIFIEDILYTISNKRLKANNILTLQELNSLDL